MVSELSILLQYQNPRVITYFCQQHPEYSTEEAELLLSDLLSWMWLSLQRKEKGKKTLLFGPLLILDELWHVFILHTKDYVDFSMQYFGAYFHHDIEPFGFEHRLNEEELSDYLQDCFLILNQDWVTRRFADALSPEL